VIAVPSAVRVWLAVGHTDMRRGMNGLALQVQQALQRDPHAGDLYVFRGKRGDLVKILWHDGVGMSLYAKRLEHGRFISYGLCQGIWTCVVYRSVGTSGVGWTRSARVRTPGSRDGRSDSYAGVGYPMMTGASEGCPTLATDLASMLSKMNWGIPSTASASSLLRIVRCIASGAEWGALAD